MAASPASTSNLEEIEVLVVDVAFFCGLCGASYRFGDFTKSLFRRATASEEVLYPRLRACLAGGPWVQTSWVEAPRGEADVSQRLVLPVSAPGVLACRLQLQVLNAVGIQSLVRGEPLIGEGSCEVGPSVGGQLDVALQRDGAEKGSVRLELHVERRRELAITALYSEGADWSIGLAGSADDVVYELLALAPASGPPDAAAVDLGQAAASAAKPPCPVAVVGPGGLVAHSVHDDNWETWKPSVWQARDEAGLLPPAAPHFMVEHGAQVPDDALSWLRSRPSASCGKRVVGLGVALRTEQEIQEFLRQWVALNPLYRSDGCAEPKQFAKDLYEFLTCGQQLRV